ISPEASAVQASPSAATPSAKPSPATPRRWPPAFDIRPPQSERGKPGSIAFEEEQEPPAPPAPKPVPTPPTPKLVPMPVAQQPIVPSPPPPVPMPVDPRPMVQSPPPRPAPHRASLHSQTTWSAWPVSPANLKQRVESMCGRLAKDVQVQTQRDGSV